MKKYEVTFTLDNIPDKLTQAKVYGMVKFLLRGIGLGELVVKENRGER